MIKQRQHGGGGAEGGPLDGLGGGGWGSSRVSWVRGSTRIRGLAGVARRSSRVAGGTGVAGGTRITGGRGTETGLRLPKARRSSSSSGLLGDYSGT